MKVTKSCYTCKWGDERITPRGRCMICLTGKANKYKPIGRIPKDTVPVGLKMKDGTPFTMEG
jgi:hypothetical protein